MKYSQGEAKAFLRWGEFRFTIGDRESVLQVYKRTPEEKLLFVPFRDATCGKETYSAGRYLNLEAERHHASEEKWIVDFNEAYNPWCVYSKTYTCPFVPPENWLEASIRAGEKMFPKRVSSKPSIPT